MRGNDTTEESMTQTSAEGLREGQRMPNFELPDENNYPYGLFEQLRRKPVVVVFYRGDW